MKPRLCRAARASLVVFLLAGCKAPAGDVQLSGIEARANALPRPTEFSETLECTPLGPYGGPAVGSRYLYRRHDGSFSQREIVSNDRGVVGFRYRDLSIPDQEPLPTRHAIAGLLVTHVGPGLPRSVAYEGDPVRDIGRLALGQTLRIPTVETSTLRGRERRVAFPTTVTYAMCGHLQVAGDRVPVRVYSIGSARRVIDRASGDHVRQGVVTYFLSDQTGYLIAIQDEATTVAERILPATFG